MQPRRQLRPVAIGRGSRPLSSGDRRGDRRRRRRRAPDDGPRGRHAGREAPRRARGGRRLITGRARRMKVLALDYGSARTGVAVSDPTGTVARPLGVVEPARERRRSRRLSDREEEAAERVVVGLPLTLRGERGEQARETSEFVEPAQRRHVPVERSTSAFTSGLAEGGDDARRRRGHLLSGYLQWSRGRPEAAAAAPPSGVRSRRASAAPPRALGVWVGRDRAPPRDASTSDRSARPLRIVFPEGFTRADGRAGHRGARDRKRGGDPRLAEGGLPRCDAALALPGFGKATGGARSRASSSRPPTSSTSNDVAAARRRPARGLPAELAQGRPARTRARRT